MQHLLSDPFQAFDFLMAGKSTATFKSVKTGAHFTYRVKRAKDRNIRFVSVLTGNETYSYIGCIFDQGNFSITKKSRCSKDAASFKAFNWAWENIRNLSIPETLEVWHEGRCGKCGRKLTEPESIACGLGPICRTK